MKEKLLEIAFRYLILNVAFLPVILVLRGFELYYLAHAVAIQEKPFAMLATGLIYDFRAFLVFALLMFFPFLLLSLINRRTGSLVYLVILGLLALLQFTLIRYFAINLVPLDDVLFRYSFSDVRMIIHNSDKLDFWTFLPMILLLFLLGILQWLAGRITMIPRVFTLLLSCYLVALFLSLLSPPALKAYGSDIVYYFKVNKSFYFIQESLSYFFREKPAGTTDDIAGEIKRYQGLHKEFDFTSTYYPLIHKEETDDVLGPLFNLKKQPPNLVFIIMESLSSALVGDQSWFGNFTPFLDSLKDQSLYWDNFLSVSERTFHVFASLFASLPYGKGEFQKDLSQIPFHYSLIRYLRENGYYTGFYYGGYAAFTNYDQFLKKQGIHFIMEDFGPAYQDKKKLYPDFYWGYHDEFTFARSLDVIDSLNKEPRLDIYLTLSTHHPFHPPDAERFLRKYEEITTRQGHPAEKKGRTDPNRKIFSSVLYTDDALRNFLKSIKRGTILITQSSLLPEIIFLWSSVTPTFLPLNATMYL
ncbi:MAG: sulfatase-like hydrolase/transferase [Bacteroidota bacterium]